MSVILLQDPRLRYEKAELGPAAAAEGGGQLRYVGAAGAYVHAEAAGYGLVDVALDQQFGDGVLDVGDAVGSGFVGVMRRGGTARPHMNSKTLTR